MSSQKNGRSFLTDYKIQKERAFQEFCANNGLPYIPDTDIPDTGSPLRDKAMNLFEAAMKAAAEKKKQEEEQEKARQKEIELQMRVEEFNKTIPTRYVKATVDDFKMGKNAQAILNGASALMLGSNGPGKTHFKWAVCKEWVKAGDTVKVVKAQELLFDIKRRDDPYAYIREAYGKRVKHLVIDETDKIFESKADFIYLNYLVDFRYEWMLQVFMIGNGDKGSFLEALGQSIFSRLTGDGGVYVLFDGKDRRQQS